LQVLKQSIAEHKSLYPRFSELLFLDEFRLLIPTHQPSLEADIGLLVFDTSIPQQSPDSWRRFNIVPMHPQYGRNLWSWGVWVYTDTDRLQREGSCDGPLIIDPTQSVIVLVPYHRECGGPSTGTTALVIRAATLVGYMSSTHTGQCIPWDDWKRDVMAVEIPPYDVSYARTFVLGSRVLLMMDGWRDSTGGCSIRAYDFSRRGCMGLVRAGHKENKRRVMPNPKKIWLPSERDDGAENMQTLGDSLVSCAVSDSQEALGLIES
jgi:hypothetical protein